MILPDRVWFAMSPQARYRWFNPPVTPEYISAALMVGKPAGETFRAVMERRLSLT